jgi:hypothetical protein
MSKMKTFSAILAAVILSIGSAGTSSADEFADLFSRVEKLNIRRSEYTLGKVLTDKQKQTAQGNAQEKAGAGTYKFKDKDLYIVVDNATDRVLILYEHYEPASRKKIRELVGSLVFDFGDPTVMAHDKIIHWAFDERGKISEQQYRETKNKNRLLKTLATVKLGSSEKIMGNSSDMKGGSVYYIISSEPILKIIKARGGIASAFHILEQSWLLFAVYAIRPIRFVQFQKLTVVAANI